MQRHMVPVLAGLSIFPLAAVGIAAYLLAAGITLVAAAVLMLACGLIATAAMVMVQLSRQNAALEDQLMFQDELEVRLISATARLTGLEEQARRSAEQAARSEQVIAETKQVMVETKMSRRERKEEAQPVRSVSPVQPLRPVRIAAVASPAPEAEKPAGRDELTLWLQPVIELASGQTSHYRAQIGLTGRNGRTVSHDEVMQKADQGGLRASLDTRLVKMVIPVLRRLRLRHPALRIFVPVGPATLGTTECVAQIMSLLRGDENLTGGIVLDITQQDLGQLDTAGIENLARLGRSGAMLCISNAHPGGLDLSALQKLGVNYLSLPANAVTVSAWTSLAKTVRVLNIEIVIAAIRSEQQATTAGRLGRFGHGPYFAPPRRVRPDAAATPAPVREASAA